MVDSQFDPLKTEFRRRPAFPVVRRGCHARVAATIFSRSPALTGWLHFAPGALATECVYEFPPGVPPEYCAAVVLPQFCRSINR